MASRFIYASGPFLALLTGHPTQPGLRATCVASDAPALQAETPIMNTCGSVLVGIISVCDTFVAHLSFAGIQWRWRMPHPLCAFFPNSSQVTVRVLCQSRSWSPGKPRAVPRGHRPRSAIRAAAPLETGRASIPLYWLVTF